MGLTDKLKRLSVADTDADNSNNETSDAAKKETAELTKKESESPPPNYSENAAVEPDAPFVPPEITGLNDAKDCYSASNPSPQQCLVHLKLLLAFHRLRTEVSSIESVTPTPDDIPSDVAKEKRWAVYVARAVYRFSTWWEKATPNTTNGKPSVLPKMGSELKDWLKKCGTQGWPVVFNGGNMPPLDVLMVWHAYTLNPRVFFEDCHRSGKVDFWKTGLPWDAINKAIDPVNFTYNLTDEATSLFLSKTGLEPNNLSMPPTFQLTCPTCSQTVEAEWTNSSGTGYGDANFILECPYACGTTITHDVLSRQKFQQDKNLMLSQKLPMPGTLFNTHGLAPESKVQLESFIFPNELVRVMDKYITALDKNATVADVRTVIETALGNKDMMRAAKNSQFSHKIFPAHKIAIRRMMSRYWSNPTPHGLNLLGAVIRQGTFVGKMAEIDWYHSPSVYSTVQRAVKRYKRFIQLMKLNPGKVLVPTLDIDLAWHTHQSTPSSYYDYVKLQTSRFIDHDDKIDESALSDAFEFTSKAYQKRFNERYSECSCWYCQTIREAHSSSIGRFFGSGSSYFNDGEVSSREENHISSHGAVRIDDPRADAMRRALEGKLEAAWRRVAERARKNGRPVPQRPDVNRRDARGGPADYYPYGTAYVGSMYAPPYVVDPCIASGYGVYSCDPACYAIGAGAVGNCCSGTCGGAVAAGGCGGHGHGGGGTCAGGCGGGAGGCGGGGAGEDEFLSQPEEHYISFTAYYSASEYDHEEEDEGEDEEDRLLANPPSYHNLDIEEGEEEPRRRGKSLREELVSFREKWKYAGFAERCMTVVVIFALSMFIIGPIFGISMAIKSGVESSRWEEENRVWRKKHGFIP